MKHSSFRWRSVGGGSAILGASCLASGWFFLFFQWFFPREDDSGLLWVLGTLLLLSVIIGIALSGPVSKTDVAIGTVVLFAACAPAFVAAPPGLLSAPPPTVTALTVIFGVATLLVAGGATATWAVCRLVRVGRAWRLSSALGLVPVLALLSIFGSPVHDSLKWGWPWSAMRPRLLSVQANAMRAAQQLGLSQRHRLTEAEWRQLGAVTPLTIDFGFPLIGAPMRARVIQLNDPEGELFIYRGQSFGPLYLRGMEIVWTDD